jgi:hypothetical protein
MSLRETRFLAVMLMTAAAKHGPNADPATSAGNVALVRL